MAVLASLLLCTTARAGAIAVQVRGPNGTPVADAVVTVTPMHPPAGPIRFPWPYRVEQRNIAFDPHVLIVPVGATVSFPNMDRVRHHVYSFSRGNRFELKLFGREDARTVQFGKPGVVAIGCNIHDQMTGFVVVVDTPFAARTGADGRVTIPEVPGGPATLAVWSPTIRAPDNRLVERLAVPAGPLSRIVAAP